MSKRKKTTVSDIIPVRDFKSWINGITEFQAADWVPNVQQWKAIMEKIQQLEEAAPVAQPTQPTQPAQPLIDHPVLQRPVPPPSRQMYEHQHETVGAPQRQPTILGVDRGGTGDDDEEYKSPYV